MITTGKTLRYLLNQKKMKHNKLLVISLAIILSIPSCGLNRMSSSFAIESMDDQQILDFCSRNQILFDLQYRMSDLNMMKDCKKYGMEAGNFANLYSPDGRLLKTATGENCEFKVMSYIQDSLKTNVFTKTDCDSCHFNYIFTKKARLLSGSPDQAVGKYKVVLGWATFLTKKKLLKQRSQELFNRIPALKQNQKDLIIIGLNFDPVLTQ